MFETSEYRQRLKRLQDNIKHDELDALVIDDDLNISYLVGVRCNSMERKVSLVVPAVGDPTLIVPRMEQETLSASVSVDNILVYWEKDAKPGRGWAENLQSTLGTAKRIGIDPLSNTEVIEALTGYQWQVSRRVEDMRVIKSPAEIALTRRIANYWTDVMNDLLGIAKVGLPVGELMALGSQISETVFANEPNASWLNTFLFQTFQCSPLSSDPHYMTFRPDQTLPHGSTVINICGVVCSYAAENERTILTGNYRAQHAELFDITHQAHELALSLIKPGVPCAEVDCAVQDFFSAQGVAEHMRHRIGHGFGLDGHERPYTSEGSKELYQPNMLISVEPGLYVDGVGGFRHSDTVLITENGIENLTSGTPRDRASLTF